MRALTPVALEDVRAARERIAGVALRTPLIRLNVEDAPAEIYLKPENLQPVGSFKARGAGNAMSLAGRDALAHGVYTASAGNMAQGVAWNARRMGIPCHVVVPEHVPQTKLAAIERLGAQPIKVPFDEWWRVIETHEFPGVPGRFVHPVCDAGVIAGNGTIGLEILEDLPDVDAVVVPFGGGGLSSGIASVIRAIRPGTKVFASEAATAAPLAAALEVGMPREIDYRASFVDGIGGKSVLPEMWPMVRELLAGSLVTTLEEIASAIRLLVERNRLVAEGAGATSVAAALAGQAGGGKVVAVVSGGNIDSEKLSRILTGELP